MITDNEGRAWILRKLYDIGYRYLYLNDDDMVMGTDKKPSFNFSGGV